MSTIFLRLFKSAKSKGVSPLNDVSNLTCDRVKLEHDRVVKARQAAITGVRCVNTARNAESLTC